MAERSSLLLIEAIRRAGNRHELVILTGNTGDIFISDSGHTLSLPKLLAEAEANEGRVLVHYTPPDGANPIIPPGAERLRLTTQPAREPVAAIGSLLQEVRRLDRPATILFDWIDALFPVGQEPLNDVMILLGAAAVDRSLWNQGHRLIVSFRTQRVCDAFTELAGCSEIDVPLPNEPERSALLGTLDCDSRVGNDNDAVAAATSGLTLREVRGRVLELERLSAPVTPPSFLPLKREAIGQRCGDALRLYGDNPALDEIAGLHAIKVLIDEHRRTGQRLPHLLLVGPPGTGKGHVVPATAATLGWQGVIWGEVMSQWVRESERRLRHLFNTIERLAPVVLHIDEIDQLIGQSSAAAQGDGGVSQRMRASLLEWLSLVSSRSDVMVIATSNRPNNLGPEWHDRFRIIPVLHPDVDSAVGVIATTAQSDGRTIDRASLRELLGAAAADSSARKLVRIYRDATIRADLAAGERTAEIPTAAFKEAIGNLVQVGPTPGEIEMALRALAMTESRSDFPWVAAACLGEPYTLPTYLRDVVDSHGDLDQGRLMQSLRAAA